MVWMHPRSFDLYNIIIAPPSPTLDLKLKTYRVLKCCLDIVETSETERQTTSSCSSVTLIGMVHMVAKLDHVEGRATALREEDSQDSHTEMP